MQLSGNKTKLREVLKDASGYQVLNESLKWLRNNASYDHLDTRCEIDNPQPSS
jgi:hypothetical protein